MDASFHIEANPWQRQHENTDADYLDIRQMLRAFVLTEIFELLGLPDFSDGGIDDDGWTQCCEGVTATPKARPEIVAERVARYMVDNPKATWVKIYYNVPHHYRSVGSFRNVMRTQGLKR